MKLFTRSAYHLNEMFFVIPGRIQMERFIPAESFRKKGNAFSRHFFFLALPGIPGNFCTISPHTPVPGSSR